MVQRPVGDVGEVRPQAWGLPLLVLVVGAFMSMLDSSIVNIAIPSIENAFGVSTETAQWVVTIYLLSLGVVVPSSAWLGDRLGLKRLYIYSLAVFTIGSALAGMSWNIASLTAFRVLQALGGGMIMPTSMSLLYRIVDRSRIGTAMGFWGLAMVAAPALGPTIGGYLVQYVDWRLIFYVNVPIGVLGVLAALAILPEFRGHRTIPLDWGGLATSAVGLFALLLALSEGQTWGWGSEAIVLLLITSATMLTLFIFLQFTGEHPLLDLRVFKYGSFSLTNFLLILISVGMFAGMFYVPVFLQTVLGFGALQTGLIMMPQALVTAVLMPFTGRLYDRIGARFLGFTGLAILALGTYFLHSLTLATSTGTIIGWMMFRGLGMSMTMMPLQTAGLSAVPTPKIGTATSLTNIIRQVAGSLGLAIMTPIWLSLSAMHAASLAATYSPGMAGQTFLQQVTGLLRMHGMSAGAAGNVATTLAYGQVERLGTTMGMDDLFVLLAVILAVGAILALGVQTHRTQGSSQRRGAMATVETREVVEA